MLKDDEVKKIFGDYYDKPRRVIISKEPKETKPREDFSKTSRYESESVGLKFDKLTVLKELGCVGGHFMVACSCSCGGRKDVRLEHLLQGQVKSCGCLKPRGSVKIGDKFNRLTVIAPSPRTSADARWLCACDCGKETVVPQYKMTRGIIMSCGCLNAELTAERNRARAKNISIKSPD